MSLADRIGAQVFFSHRFFLIPKTADLKKYFLEYATSVFFYLAPISSFFRKKDRFESPAFSQLAEISEIDFWKQTQNLQFLGSRSRKCFDKLWLKNSETPKIWLGASSSRFYSPFSKNAFGFFMLKVN